MNDALELFYYTKEKYNKLKEKYLANIKEEEYIIILCEVKNILDNLRSILDYIAYNLYKKYGGELNQKNKIYFPYIDIGKTEKEFREHLIKKYSYLIENKELYRKIVSIQINNNQYWLINLVKLNNNFKHVQLKNLNKFIIKQVTISNEKTSIYSNGNIQIQRLSNNNIGIYGNGSVSMSGNGQVMIYSNGDMIFDDGGRINLIDKSKENLQISENNEIKLSFKNIETKDGKKHEDIKLIIEEIIHGEEEFLKSIENEIANVKK